MGNARRDLKTKRWRNIRKVVLERDCYECQIRGPRCTGEATQVDHIVAAAFGGDDDYGNLRAACRSCNASLGAKVRGGASFDRRVDPCPPLPSALSLAGTRETPMRTRVHRPLP